MCPSSWKARMRWSGMPRPTWMSGEVTSIPSFTRSGRPSASLPRARPPAGRRPRCGSARRGPATGESRRYNPRASRAAYRSTAGAARSARRRIRKLRLLRPRPGPVPARRRRRSRFGLVTAIASEIPQLDPARTSSVELRRLHLRPQRPARARRAARPREPRHRALEPDRADDEAGDRRDRGQALLRAPRRRPARRSCARVWADVADKKRRPGRLDDHAAVRQERLRRRASARSAAS